MDSELRDKERTISRSTSRTNGEAENLLRSSQHSEEGKETWSQNHIGEIPEQAAVPKITNRHRMGRSIMRPLRRDCSRVSLLCRDSGRAGQK